MSKREKIWILSVSSESCDHFGPYLFGEKLSDQELLDFLRTEVSPDDCMDDDYKPIMTYDSENEGCPGFSGTTLHVEWEQDIIR